MIPIRCTDKVAQVLAPTGAIPRVERVARSLSTKVTLPIEVLATIRLPKGKRLAIGKEIESLLDSLAVDGSVAYIDALFLRIYRATK